MGTVENTEAINNRQQVNFGGLEVENKNGYCDLHPDSKLVDGGPPWLLFQDGSDRAACNPFQIWRCSRSDCIRCYERSMFGYFNMDHARGSSVQLNALPQQRCYRHHQLSFDPFMFIGKIGTNRQFRCPVRGCENLGPEVAEHVADIDQAGEEPSVRPKRFSNETEKEAFELAVFHEFIKAAKLLVDWAENAKPNHPDIRCSLNGQEYWFELGRITNETLAQKIKGPWPDDPRPFSFSQEEPLVRIINKKSAANYDTNGHPVDLVLHFDQQRPDQTMLGRCIQKHAAAFHQLRHGGPFSRIWIYDAWSKSVLWSCSS